MPWWSVFKSGSGKDEGTPDYYAEGLALAGQERFHEALTSFRLALRERPADVASLEQMAVVYTRMGMTDEALKVYTRALEKEPESAGAHYGLGFLYLKRGQEDLAAEHLQAFLNYGADVPESAQHVRHARNTLDSLQTPAAPGGESVEPSD
jgi:tetratricopeptide (TPR) repeat protein